jgi:hypothetical protein
MKTRFLIAGDILAIGIVTFIGFATHGETDLAFLPRMLAAFLPLTFSWLLLAPPLGLFEPAITSNFKQLWRPAFAMLFAAPFAAVLRGLWLHAPLLPVFALVLASTSALGMVIWRGLYAFLTRKRQSAP